MNYRSQGAVTFNSGLFNGMLFKDFVLNGFNIGYTYYQMRRIADATTATFAASIKLVVYSPSQNVGTTYIWEPAANGDYAFQTWSDVSLDQNIGYNGTWPGPEVNSPGWWTSGGNALWVTPPTPPNQQAARRSLWRYVYSLVNSSKPAIDDAIITQIQLGIGSNVPNQTTAVEKVRVTSGVYDYTWYFRDP